MARKLPAAQEMIVLRLLSDTPKGMYAGEIARMSNNAVRGIHMVVQRMEAKGFVKSRTPKTKPVDQAGLPRPQYKITALGKRALQAADSVSEYL